MIIVTDKGFGADEWQGLPVTELDNSGQLNTSKADLKKTIIMLKNDDSLGHLIPHLKACQRISVDFPASSDGRGFSIARLLRLYGYTGRLRASGIVLADQYRHARQSGFDEVAISTELATRMPEAHWLEQSPRLSMSYQDRIYKTG
jgi:uncharacterized protein (DUF934 family)